MERYPPVPYNQNRFQPPPNQLPEEPRVGKIYWVLGILFVVIVVIIYFLVSGMNNPKTPVSQENVSGESPLTPTSQSLVSCEDSSCFVTTSQNCSKANLTNTQSIDFLGLNITTTTYYELKGRENEQCAFYLRTEEQHINFTEELVQQMIDGGSTTGEVSQQEQVSNENANLLEGRNGTCKFLGNNVTIFLNKWFSGNFSGEASCNLTGSGNWTCNYSGDWELTQDCEGNYFSQEL